MRTTTVLLLARESSFTEVVLGALNRRRFNVQPFLPEDPDRAPRHADILLLEVPRDLEPTYRWLRKESPWSGVPAIVFTVDDGIERLASENGDAVVRRPCGPEAIVDAVAKASRANRTILVADDSPLIRKLYRRFLENEGYRIVEASDGKEAIDMVCREIPDLVITDIKMPIADGYEVCRRIKESKETEHVPVIITSAMGSEIDIDRGFLVGANEYLTKPVDLAELASRIDSIFRGIDRRGRESILVVAPDPIERSMIEYGLSQQGFEAVVLQDPEEAVGAASRILPSMVIADAELPGMPLGDLRRRLLSTPDLDGTPFVIMTSRSARMEVGERTDHAALLTKPFPMDKLVAVVERILGERRTRLELERELLLHTITSLVRTLEARDHYTRGHSENVARYSEAIARRLFNNPEKVKQIRLGALLHDIGKIGVRDDVLLKEGRLTPEEFELVKKHPVIGAEILEPIPSLALIIPMVRWHHERIDGLGYPDALPGAKIPLSAKIVAVADTFDALTSKRPYRGAIDIGQAMKILKDVAGTQLDAEIVEHFLALDPQALYRAAHEQPQPQQQQPQQQQPEASVSSPAA